MKTENKLKRNQYAYVLNVLSWIMAKSL